ncbi:hypothetical protein QCA50_012080 [Cerrena zonata]|uniref:Cytochrome b5 heme-binding domain-containing protein n=1 Tax=Cerrena zonata TaxID=2478898 RepID=A0AAW0FVB9_9APHY
MAVNSGFESGTKIVSPKGIKVQKRKVRATNIANETGSLSNNPSQLLNHASHLKNAHMNEIKKRKQELCQTPENLVMQLKIQQQQEIINRLKSQLNWGTPISKLPLIKPSEFNQIISSPQHDDRIYIVIQNIIHDVTPFADQHPGGIPLLKASRGKDATKAFYGGVYGHLTAAVNLLATMRIGVLDQGNDEEVWRRVVREEGEVNENDSRRENKLLYRTAEAA